MAKSSRLGQVLSALRLEEGFLEAQLGKVRDDLAALGGVGNLKRRIGTSGSAET